MFAAEITTENGYHIIVDRDKNTLRRRTDSLFNDSGDVVLDSRVGHVDSDDVEESIDLVRKGQWGAVRE